MDANRILKLTPYAPVLAYLLGRVPLSSQQCTRSWGRKSESCFHVSENRRVQPGESGHFREVFFDSGAGLAGHGQDVGQPIAEGRGGALMPHTLCNQGHFNYVFGEIKALRQRRNHGSGLSGDGELARLFPNTSTNRGERKTTRSAYAFRSSRLFAWRHGSIASGAGYAAPFLDLRARCGFAADFVHPATSFELHMLLRWSLPL